MKSRFFFSFYPYTFRIYRHVVTPLILIVLLPFPFFFLLDDHYDIILPVFERNEKKLVDVHFQLFVIYGELRTFPFINIDKQVWIKCSRDFVKMK
jgi:hypothetical protein